MADDADRKWGTTDRPSRWRERSLVAAGIRLAAFEAGSERPGARALLLLHGLGHWSQAAWDRLVPLLDPALRCIAIDLPGFGASEKPSAPYDLPFFRAVLENVVRSCGLRRFALAGHSLGGFLAADFAGAHPDAVERLVLIAPAGFARTPRYLVYALASGFARRLFTRRPSRAFVERTLVRSVVDARTLDRAVLDRAYALSQELPLREAFAGVYAGAMQAFARRGELHRGFARYRGPVFCVWGRHDRYIPLGALAEVRRVYPAVQTLVLPRSGHLPMVEQPEPLGAALRAFLA